MPSKHCKDNMWLIKPANLNQGRGIEIFTSLKDILVSLNSKYVNTIWLLQKYIERPLLYHGRKFDIRIWAIMTNKCEVFVYRRGNYLLVKACKLTLSLSNYELRLHTHMLREI